MRKDKWSTIRDFIVRNCKIVFPVILVVVVAFTVVVALNANKAKAEEESSPEESSSGQESQQAQVDPTKEQVPLTVNEDQEVYALVSNYYSARGAGDMESMRAAYDEISENDLLYYSELAKYIDHYGELEVYSKQGPVDGSVIAYVYFKMGIINYEEVPGYETLYLNRDENGALYIKNESNFTEEENSFITAVNGQVDVVDFNNRVNTEYNEVVGANSELLEYLGLLNDQVQTAVGVQIAARNAEQTVPESVEGEGNEQPEGGEEAPTVTEPPAESGPQYATATTTVNVRSSDSEQADKLGKVSGGTRVEVLEIRVNGWTKIMYEGKDGYIKSEYLQMEESAGGVEAVGTVTATSAVNVRSAANETANRLGVLPMGESLDLLGNEGDWCKVRYNGQVGYVKAEFVTQQ
ncbi:MAG: SH3 domain-containing protein [Acetatifactor sp.]|nr:SH3 domain-containing protein [Acetatifactor sp.]